MQRIVSNKFVEKIVFALLLLLGIGLRFFMLNKSLSGDEFFLIDIIRSFNMNQAFGVVLSDVHPPLFFISEYAIMKILPEKEFYLRLLPCICGVCTIIVGLRILILIYKNCEKCLHWLVGFSIIIFSQPLIAFAQEARPYSQLYLLSILLLLLSVMKYYYNRNYYRVALLISIAAVFTHYFGFLYVLSWAIIDIIINHQRASSKKSFGLSVILSPALIVITTIILIAGFYILAYKFPGGLTERIAQQRIPVTVFTLPKWLAFNLVGHYYFNFVGKMPSRIIQLSDIVSNLLLIIPVIILLLSIITVVILGTRRQKRNDITTILLLFSFIPFILALLGNLAGIIPFVREKYLIGTVVPFLFLFIFLNGYFTRRSAYLLTALLISLNLYSGYNFYFKSYEVGRWEHWREATKYIEKQANAEDDIILWYSYSTEPKTHLYNYYSSRSLHHLSLCNGATCRPDSLASIEEQFKQKKGSIYFIYYDNQRINCDLDSYALQFLNKKYREVESNCFGPRLCIYRFIK
ncbi:MAG TPA: hypothetical protein PKZ83_13320 [bacterium]|nr:hypothetical protein [bacterium]HQJ65912.1 hypothetical protein [bacterium]